MADCLFVSKEILPELEELGLQVNESCVDFAIDKVDGRLIPDKSVADFVKKSGVRLEKVNSDYEDIYKLLGYLKPTLKKEVREDYIDAKGGATVVDEEYAGEKKPEVKKVTGDLEAKVEKGPVGGELKQTFPDPEALKTKLTIAIAAMQELVKSL